MKKYLINPNQKLSKISRDIYGHFSEHLGRCIYEGLYVGEDSEIPNVKGMRCDVVNALKEIRIPVLRWPGGCFADEYHWMDGIGPKEKRKKMVNTHWGGVTEDNSFGTHEFFELCEQLGCEAYINGNVGSGTVREMCDWVEYMTFDGISAMADLRRKNGRDKPWRVKYFGIGNETWGCGGHMLPEDYVAEYRKYETYIRDYDSNKHIFRVACGPDSDNYHWTEVLLQKAESRIEGLSLHYYCGPMNHEGDRGHATDFDADDYYGTLKRSEKIEEILTRHENLLDHYDPKKRIALIVDEWGAWYKVEKGTNPGFLYQQNTMRDAIIAAMNLNVFNKHSDRVRMANIAQTVNVLQSVALTDGEKMLLTPTYYVFKLFREHQDSTLLGSFITNSKVGGEYNITKFYESASLTDDGTIISTIANTSESEGETIDCQIADFRISSIEAEILSGDMNDHNTFDDTENVKPKPFTDFTVRADGFTAELPACCVVRFIIK
ncbi:MAG: alpha-N-arabinofuranosidase [Clostridia bacterium]|nr:alpha-N-arabinofuranosidase [Clostridia bacterium]